MFKKIATLACVSGIAATAVLSADAEMQGPEMYSGGFTLGSSYNIGGGTGTAVTFGYIDNEFLFDVGVGYNNFRATGFKTQNRCDLSAHLGLRTRLFQNLFVTYGAVGSVVVGDVNTSGRPYTAGAFTGLDLQLARHFLLSGKINPYLFQRPMKGFKANSVFSTGTIALSYVF